jgi:uncharacterized protein YjbI with pentapeptide repeats
MGSKTSLVAVLVRIAPFLDICCKKAKKHKTILMLISFAFVVALVLVIFNYCFNFVYTDSVNQVSQYGITNVTEKANLINQYRTTSIQFIATCAQIFGGIAIFAGLYFAWGNLTTARDSQITERFTRAVDQLGAIDKDGNQALEIRLGGIYALERIADESEKDYWTIMVILTAYVRKNSSTDDEKVNNNEKIPLDIQTILTVIGRRKYYSYEIEYLDLKKYLDLRKTNLNGLELRKANLKEADLQETNLQNAKLIYSNLQGANLQNSNLQNANLIGVKLQWAFLESAKLQHANLTLAILKDASLNEANLKEVIAENSNFEGANFGRLGDSTLINGANLEQAYLRGSNFKKANLRKANLKGANLEMVDLEETNLQESNLKGVKGLTIDQLSKVKTLYNAELDDELLIPLKEKYPALFDKPED